MEEEIQYVEEFLWHLLSMFVLVSCGSPPKVANASTYGRPKTRYPISSVVGYRCDEGFVQRNLPVIKCQSDGVWEEPQINCLLCK